MFDQVEKLGLKIFAQFHADGKWIFHFDSEKMDTFRHGQIQLAGQRQNLSDPKEMGCGQSSRTQVTQRDLVQKTWRRLPGLNRVDHEEFADSNNVVEKGQPHFGTLKEANLGETAKLLANSAHDLQPHRVVAENVVAQAEEQDRLRRRCWTARRRRLWRCC